MRGLTLRATAGVRCAGTRISQRPEPAKELVPHRNAFFKEAVLPLVELSRDSGKIETEEERKDRSPSKRSLTY